MRVAPPTVEALSAGATLVTANRRLARAIALAYEHHQAGSGCAFWESADILPWSAWLRRCWHDHVNAAEGDQQVLLSEAQEDLLWERIIEDSPESAGLLNVSGAAVEARKAYELLHSWRLSLADPSFALYEDATALQHWARQFERVASDNRWMSSARLEAEISRRLERGEIVPPKRLLHAGFDEMTPAAQRLLAALRGAGCVVEEVPFEAEPAPSAVRVVLPDALEELRAAAHWARARLEASPTARVGVVVPDLSAVRKAAERVFDEALNPDFTFHISAGPAVTEIPVTAAALNILALGRGKVNCADAGLLLRSPFIAGADRELGSRALVDAEIRRRGMAEVSLATLARSARGAAPELARRLRGLLHAFSLVSARRGASQWGRVFSRLLRVAGWPGDRTLDSPEYQAIDHWHDLLSQFAALEVVSGPMDYSSALSRLHHMAAGSQSAPADKEAQVQVLGQLEASGSCFEHLWVTGLEDRNWPAPPRPNPFLPPSLQRARGMPHCSAERELAYARLVTGRLLASAADVVVSYPKRDGDTGLRPSPLIRGLPEAALPDTTRMPRRSSPELEKIEDHSGPPLPEGTTQRGGMAVIERQAACPFRAFAEFRLGARELEEAVLGFNPQERGKMVHSALEILWGELKTHSALMKAGQDHLTALVSRSVRQAIAKETRGRGAGAMQFLQSLEQRRLEKLLMDWLEKERERSPFEVVASERGRHISIGGMELDVKVDRVDALADGRHVIIDYKTGKANPSQWEGERPDAPQLPLYAVTHGSRVGAVAFARVVAGESEFMGLGEEAGIPRVKEYSASKPGKAAGGTLETHIKEWGLTVERLAREFATGGAVVAPRNHDTCDNCPLPALCRIGDLPPRMEREEADE